MPTKAQQKKTSKLLEIILSLNVSQKRDLSHFVQMPSNRLTQRDKDIFNALLLKSKPKSDESKLWQQILTDEELDNIDRIKNRLQKMLSRYLRGCWEILYFCKIDSPKTN